MERTLFEVNPPTTWLGRSLEVVREIDSTNRLAEQRAGEGAPEGLVVIADSQTAGRGRLGRSFFSPPDRNLYLSALLRPSSNGPPLPQHVFAASWAAAETIGQWLPADVPIEIKWPNDVMLRGRKTSGINLPVQTEQGRIVSLVIGIGVNLNLRRHEFPAVLRESATSLLEEGGRRIDRVEFTQGLLGRLEAAIEQLRAGRFDQVLDGWKKYFRMHGDRVRIGGPGVPRVIEGSVEGLDPEGALLVRSGERVARVLAGDVTLLSREV